MSQSLAGILVFYTSHRRTSVRHHATVTDLGTIHDWNKSRQWIERCLEPTLQLPEALADTTFLREVVVTYCIHLPGVPFGTSRQPSAVLSITVLGNDLNAKRLLVIDEQPFGTFRYGNGKGATAIVILQVESGWQ